MKNIFPKTVSDDEGGQRQALHDGPLMDPVIIKVVSGNCSARTRACQQKTFVMAGQPSPPGHVPPPEIRPYFTLIRPYFWGEGTLGGVG